ncbi:hypothetical protein DPMN_083797 [Dreissena polymorpha]|uniref:FYN-binding protein n=1 Tax=Dreissena polymorpha TaxID=45954 RepID=A0A9D3YDM2_DREPO|nr:hypothetical protein DPMN_083797 [Dreissena polymorpha]
MEDGEDIYDDTGAEKMADEFKMQDIRKRFETQGLNIGPKPANAKIGGGPGLQLATGNGVVSPKNPGVVFPKSPGVVSPKSPGVDSPKSPAYNKASSAIVQNSTQKNDSEPPADKSERRLSKVEEMKLQLEGKSSAPDIKPKPAGIKPKPDENKPKLALKPPVATKTNDQNNNANASSASSSTASKFGELAAKFGQQAALENASKSASGGDKFTSRKTSDSSVDHKPTAHPSLKPSVGAPQYAPVSVQDLRAKLTHVDVTLRTNFISSTQNVIRKSVIRKLDGKKFHTVDFPKESKSEPCPSKPPSLDIDLDLDKMIAEFEETVKNMDVSNDHGWTEMDEEYDDCGNVVRPVSTRVVSLILPMTEEEEQKEEEELKRALVTDNLPPPPPELQEEYDDVAVNKNGTEELTQDEEYEELPGEDDIPPPAGPKPSFSTPKILSVPVPPRPHGSVDSSTSDIPDTAEKTKDAKELEKEKKEREKEEKRKEKERKEQEKKMKKLAKDLKVDVGMLSNCVAKGRVKASNTPKKKKGFEIAVIEGEEVDIIRMVDNPKGKWLIKITSSQKIGYCDESNIEVDTNSILNYMKSGSSSTALADGPQETYEDVEAKEGDEPLEQDEIYEECS